MFTLLMICLIRALRFRPAVRRLPEPEKLEFDRQKAVSDLKEMIKIRTVSYNDTEKEDSAEFEKFIELLPRLFPLTHKKLSLTRVEPKGLLYKWQGKSSKEPTVLMAHFDVVPADGEVEGLAGGAHGLPALPGAPALRGRGAQVR